MNVLILNGSPHSDGPTSAMIKAFTDGATQADHNCETINVFDLDIAE